MKLENAIAEAKSARVAFDHEEHTQGVSAVGTWFTDSAGQIYALSLPVPSVRFGDGGSFVAPLLQAREAILKAIAG